MASEVASTDLADTFATTRWTVVRAAGQSPTPQATVALEELCRTYWYPLYAYVRRRGHPKEDAEDLTQAFFARFLARNYLDTLDSEKGKFRAFLLAALKHFLANEWDRMQCQKRGGGDLALSLDWHDADTRYQMDPADTLSPDILYDRTWAMALLERVILRLGELESEEGRGVLFERLKPSLMQGKGTLSYAEVARELTLTEGAVRVAAHRLRRRYRELLRQEVAQTLSENGRVEDELAALFEAFA